MTATILVVDDEVLLEKLITQHFRKKIRQQEYRFIFARNGREAIEKIEANLDIDMILTDINMPEMDGLTLLSKLQNISQVLRTVIVSAYGDMKNIRKAMNQGAFDFINKPIDLQDLEITINRTIEYVQQIKKEKCLLQQAQIQLIQSEKMSAIGKLVTGVAHEINNPLTFIVGNLNEVEISIENIIKHLRLYQEKFPDSLPEIEEHAKEIDLEYLMEELPKMIASMNLGTERISEISASLLNFSRTDGTTKIPVDIHEGIDSTLMILRHRLRGNEKRPAIEVIKEYSDLPLVECYPGQLYQVFMNIIANGIDAVNEASVKHSFAEIKKHPYQIRISTEILESENVVIIRIKDNGAGMSDEVKEQVFDYLFTTKPTGKGTGLGLSISRSIVEEKHGGKLSFTSVNGVGTEFVIEIPIA
jgi:two-component system NtrC family sensor kinase